MIVRCGRCQTELEVSGPGEFACPKCGTRNVVRGPAASPFDLPDLGRSVPPPSETDTPARWVACPSCKYRFVIGDVDEVSCPTCSARLAVREDGVEQISA
jgi:DNA-directed RNA polymerase subunit RPC12/RpoP